MFFSLPLACVQEREIDCSCILFFTSKSLSLTAVPFNMAHLACKSPFLSSFGSPDPLSRSSLLPSRVCGS